MGAKLSGERRMIHIDADSDHDIANARCFGIHLSENAAELLAVEQKIIGPAQVGM